MSALAMAVERRPSDSELTIDLSAVAANARTFSSIAGGELMAVVKANGFGHGAVPVARTVLANGATRLGVTTIEEALELRNAGIDAPILSWLNTPDAEFRLAQRRNIAISVPSTTHLAAITASAPGAVVHLHLDTGMARDGAPPDEWAQLCQSARRAELKGLVRVDGVMGHLACAQDPGTHTAQMGRIRFKWGLRVARTAGLRPKDLHLAGTVATVVDPKTHYTMSRIGVGLAGVDPTGSVVLRPALRLVTPIVSTRTVRAGTGVGYDHTWTAPRSTTLGLLPVGYADGLPRSASNRAEVQINGRRCPVVGRISMDMTVVDLGDAVGVGAGTPAIVFGPGAQGEPTVAEWARWSDTIEHEILTGLGPRLHRTVLPDLGVWA